MNCARMAILIEVYDWCRGKAETHIDLAKRPKFMREANRVMSMMFAEVRNGKPCVN